MHLNQSKPVPSPCVDICALDSNDVCIGCRRTAIEIGRWWEMTDEEKRKVLKEITVRETAK